MAVSKRTRYEVLRRDGHSCRYCGATAADSPLTIDHVIPVALGGSDAPENLVAACRDCNAGKSSTSPDAEAVESVADDAIRWSVAMQRAAEVLDSKVPEKEAYVAAFLGSWPSYRNVSASLIATVERFYSIGLPKSVMTDAAEVAASQPGVLDRNAYFAGICWKRVRAMQEIASQILESEAEDGS